jgi:hypothetical protein
MPILALRWRHFGAGFFLAASGLLLVACGGEDGTNGAATLMRTTAEPAGSNCANGGTRVDAGLDTNGDGELSAAETTSTQFVCNGANGLSALVAMTSEPAGSNCAAGGKRITSGSDANGNGVLDAGEVGSTRYVCNGVAGPSGLNSLVAIVAEAAGTHCAAGGNKITAGLDSNDNGVLDAGEVTSTYYQCDGVAGANGSTGPAGAPFPWIDAPADVQAVSNTGYLADSSASLTVTLPVAPAVGDVVRISGVGTGGWTVGQQGTQSILTVGMPLAPMGTAWTRHGPTDSWRAIASSADGIKLAAIDQSDTLYTSIDGGQTWNQQGFGFSFGAKIASSADGQILLATPAGTGSLLFSYDAGQSWFPSMASSDWRAIAMSADGNIVYAVDAGQVVWTSYYGGNVSAQATLPGTTTAMACSADCSRAVAVNSTGELLLSDNSGGFYFTPVNLGSIQPDFETVTMSADGSHILAGGPDALVGSSDFFVNSSWYSSGGWTASASSADGLRVMLSSATVLRVSLDGAKTWTDRTPPTSGWTAVAMSSDGSRLVAADGTGISTSVSTTTPGPTGSISGLQYGAIELQYVGNDNFAILSSNGVMVAR